MSFAMERKTKLIPIKNTMSSMQSLKTIHPLFLCIYLSKKWSKIVGVDWDKVSKPVSYSNQCLTIQMQSSTHLYEAQFQKESLEDEINKHFRQKYIRQIRFIS